MKSIFLAFFFTGMINMALTAQTKFPSIDKSPLDMSYYPDKYPLLKIQDKITDPLAARVIYSRPQKNDREIFGKLIEFGKVWRLGANEATEIEFFRDVKINDTKVKKGRYTLYAIPAEEKWTFILNKETDIWGSYKYEIKNDVLRMDIPVEKLADTREELAMVFEKAETGANLIVAWENVKLSLPIVF